MRLNLLWELRDVRNLDGMFVSRYRTFMEILYPSQRGSFVHWGKFDEERRHLFEIASVRYLLVEKGDVAWGEKQIRLLETMQDIRKVYEDDSLKIYENIRALERAYFVDSYILAPHGKFDYIKDVLSQPDFNHRRDTIVELPDCKSPVFKQFHDKEEKNRYTMQFTKDEPVQVTIILSNTHPGFLILNDTFYDGWKVYINGLEKNIYPANIMMRAVYIDNPGDHEIIFTYPGITLGAGAALPDPAAPDKIKFD